MNRKRKRVSAKPRPGRKPRVIPPLTTVDDRREKLLAALPEHGWSIAKAGLAAGYTESYAVSRLPRIIAKDVDFCRRIVEKRREIEATQTDKVDKLIRSWEEIASDPHVAVRDRLKAGELLGKYHAIFSERHVLEIPDRQRQLSAAEQEEARMLAESRFRPALPAVSPSALPPVFPMLQAELVKSTVDDCKTTGKQPENPPQGPPDAPPTEQQDHPREGPPGEPDTPQAP